MKATGIVRRIDDLGRVVIPKEIRRTMRIREGDPLLTTLKSELDYLLALLRLADRLYNPPFRLVPERRFFTDILSYTAEYKLYPL